jgi:hypothetical protein
MTCFRLKNGTTVHSITTDAQYVKFARLVEDGYDTEEAFKEAIRPDRKRREAICKEAKEILDEVSYRHIIQRMYRTKSTFADAYQWAKDTGRLWKNAETAKVTLELLKKGYKDV